MILIHSYKKVMINALFLLFFSLLSTETSAAWTGVPGVQGNCPVSHDTPMTGLYLNEYIGGYCTLNIGKGNTVPASGYYGVALYQTNSPDSYNPSNGEAFAPEHYYIAAGQDLSTLQFSFSYSGKIWETPKKYMCYVLFEATDYVNHQFLFNNTPQGCLGGGKPPLPPAPVLITCTFNNGNALDVSLGDVDRSIIGTLPGTTPATDKLLDVTCTGTGTATYSIKFQFTPGSTDGNQYIHSSANGLSVAMSLNDTVVDTGTTYTRTYNVGTQTEKLSFEPVRDPSVAYTDIPTGAFTASAVMIATLE